MPCILDRKKQSTEEYKETQLYSNSFAEQVDFKILE